MSLPDPLTRLIEELVRLPGIGPKGAQRLAFHLLKTPREFTDRLVDALRDVKERVTYCSICNTITDIDPCAFCSNDARDRHVICVVEEPQNVTAIEKTREFKGLYHVLMGALSPLQGIGPDDLKIKGLLGRIGTGVNEVILATNPNVEGEATAIYLARLLKPLGVKVTRIAMGVTNSTGMIIASLIGGIAGAMLLMFAYFIGIALVGAGLGALVAHVAWSSLGRTGDPPAVAVVVLSIVGSIGAMFLQRYVIVVATSFGGAWTVIVGGLAIAGDRGAARAATAGDVWILYPTSPAPGQRWVPVAWIALGLFGTAVQLITTGRKKKS